MYSVSFIISNRSDYFLAAARGSYFVRCRPFGTTLGCLDFSWHRWTCFSCAESLNLRPQWSHGMRCDVSEGGGGPALGSLAALIAARKASDLAFHAAFFFLAASYL